MPTALIIDDDDQILAMVEERLASMGHDCRKAQSQTQAEELLEQHAFDYILLDLEIPSRFQGRADMIYGQNLLRKLVDTPEHANTPVIVITAHGVGSYHLCAEMMMVGASGFVGKPFGRDNPLEDKIREVLKKKKRGGAVPNGQEASAKLTPFKGGDLVFFDDRIELCGVRVCGGKGSSTKRMILELLREKNSKNAFVKLQIAELKRRGVGNNVRDGHVAESVADLRRACKDRLREALGIECNLQDVIANERHGYYLKNWIAVKDGIDNTERTAQERGMAVSPNQKRIIQQLRKHQERTPRQLCDNLSLRAEVITREIEPLLKAGLIRDIGSTRNKKFCLVDAESAGL